MVLRPSDLDYNYTISSSGSSVAGYGFGDFSASVTTRANALKKNSVFIMLVLFLLRTLTEIFIQRVFLKKKNRVLRLSFFELALAFLELAL